MILDLVRCPGDLEFLSHEELRELSWEIRKIIIDVVSQNGGHLASNLGIVELTLSIHRIFNSPMDKIIWDVGHQCYTHKIITGRRNQFSSIRTLGGLSGFPKICESEHDIFNTGHSSTSISAAEGLSLAGELLGESGQIVAVIGDGALTGGMAFEALNHAGHKKCNMTVILNDNEMSISPNVGALSMYLHKLRLEPAYTTPKDYLAHIMKQLPGVGARLYGLISRIEGSLKYLLTPGMLFEEFGFKYFGPVDGYDFETLERALMRAKDRKGPVLVHVLTKKGKGYQPAIEQCNKFHGIGPFEIKTGKVKKSGEANTTYTEIFSDLICNAAENNKNIVAITAAMKEGTGLEKFSTRFPSRFFDVGIAEQHAVTMAAGMAKAGLKPIVAIYSTFLQRAFDQVLHDVALMKLPVIFCLDRSGIVGEDGPTHHGVFDISFLRPIPGLIIVSPRDEIELEQMFQHALTQEKPVVIRYPRGVGTGNDDSLENRQKITTGCAEIIKSGDDLVIWAIGNMVEHSLSAANMLAEKGINASVVNARFVSPFDKKLLLSFIEKKIPIVTTEENMLAGGFGSMIAETAIEQGFSSKFLKIGIGETFVQHGTQSELRAKLRIDANGIYERICAMINAD